MSLMLCLPLNSWQTLAAPFMERLLKQCIFLAEGYEPRVTDTNLSRPGLLHDSFVFHLASSLQALGTSLFSFFELSKRNALNRSWLRKSLARFYPKMRSAIGDIDQTTRPWTDIPFPRNLYAPCVQHQNTSCSLPRPARAAR